MDKETIKNLINGHVKVFMDKLVDIAITPDNIFTTAIMETNDLEKLNEIRSELLKQYIEIIHPNERATPKERRKKDKIAEDIVNLINGVVENKKILNENQILKLETETDTDEIRNQMQLMVTKIQEMQKKLEYLEKEKNDANEQTRKLTIMNENLTTENELLKQEITLLTTYEESDDERDNKRRKTSFNSQLNNTIKLIHNKTNNTSEISNKSVSFNKIGQTSTPNNRNSSIKTPFNNQQAKYNDSNNSKQANNTNYDRSTVLLRKGRVTVIKADKSHEKIKCEPKIKTFAIFLGRIKPSVSENDIIDMLENDIELKVLKLVKLESKQTRFSSYRLIIPHEQKDRAYNSTKWPKHIIARKFFYKRKEIINENENIYEHDNEPMTAGINNIKYNTQNGRTKYNSRPQYMETNCSHQEQSQ